MDTTFLCISDLMLDESRNESLNSFIFPTTPTKFECILCFRSMEKTIGHYFICGLVHIYITSCRYQIICKNETFPHVFPNRRGYGIIQMGLSVIMLDLLDELFF